MPRLCCPVCGGELVGNERSYCCEKGHSYDVAKQNYVNLLMSNKSSSKRHGDDKLMVKARKDFLERMISILESHNSHTLSSNLQPFPSEPMHLMGVITDGSLYLPTSCDVLYGD